MHNTLDQSTYVQLVRIAKRRMPQHEAHDLVHAAWAKLQRAGFRARDAAHFRAAVIRAMRQEAIDTQRAQSSQKRGGQWSRTTEVTVSTPPRLPDPDLDRALERLRRMDRAAAEVVVLKGRDGLTTAECARRLGRSPRSVAQKWSAGRSFLRRELTV